MRAGLRGLTDRILGRGQAALTVPPLDGAWKPNTRLEDAPQGYASAAPHSLVLRGGEPLWASGAQVLGRAGPVLTAPAEVTALALSPDDQLAVAAVGAGVQIGEARPEALRALGCVTGLAFDAAGGLWISAGSTVNPFPAWSRDFLEQRRSGQLWYYAEGQLRLVAEGLGWPWGLLVEGGGVILSESWEKRLVHFDKAGRSQVLVADLPGYPAGLARGGSGGTWLSLFAPRSPLLELVLREPKYRREMMEEVPPAFWIAPALASGRHFSEPMQGGALKQMGQLKPWAPSLSGGLVVEFNAAWTPVRSLHSRAGGRRHGITALGQHGETLWLASTGGDEIVAVSLTEEGQDATGH